jgi:hypothetical protein
MEDFGIFNGHLVYFTAIWHTLWPLGCLVYFFRFGILYQEKSGNPDDGINIGLSLTDLPRLLHDAEELCRHVGVLQVDGERERRDAPQRQRHVQLVVAAPHQLPQEQLVAVADGPVQRDQLPRKLLLRQVRFAANGRKNAIAKFRVTYLNSPLAPRGEFSP